VIQLYKNTMEKKNRLVTRHHEGYPKPAGCLPPIDPLAQQRASGLKKHREV